MVNPIGTVGLVPLLQPLHLPLAQLQHFGGFRYAHPALNRVLDYFDSL